MATNANTVIMMAGRLTVCSAKNRQGHSTKTVFSILTLPLFEGAETNCRANDELPPEAQNKARPFIEGEMI